MNHRRNRSIIASIATITALTLGACSSDKKDSTSVPAAAESSQPESDGGDVEEASVPSDVCALFDNAAVSALLGEEVVGEPTPSGGCKFNGSSAASLYPVIEIGALADYGDLASWQVSVESVLSAAATPITVAGNSAFIVEGSMGEIQSTQGAMEVQGLLVQVTLASPDPAANAAAMTGLMELVAAGL